MATLHKKETLVETLDGVVTTKLLVTVWDDAMPDRQYIETFPVGTGAAAIKTRFESVLGARKAAGQDYPGKPAVADGTAITLTV